MPSPCIKICGVRTPEIAQYAAMAGANWIGIIFHPASKRFVTTEQATSIAIAALEAGAKPVGVFVHHTAQQIQDICEQTGIRIVQLHGAIARSQHHLLPSAYQRIYVREVTEQGGVIADTASCYCDPMRDFILFDNVCAGQGHVFDWSTFQYPSEYLQSPGMRMGFAGGLTPDNVALAMRRFRPALLDVASGVENAKGEKDRALINQFIVNVRIANNLDKRSPAHEN